MKLNDYANRIENATYTVLEEGKYVTGDLGGKSTTTDYTKAIIDKLWFINIYALIIIYVETFILHRTCLLYSIYWEYNIIIHIIKLWNL